MPIDPYSEIISFPNSIDSFPTVYDSGTVNIPERETKFWASHYNKIKNFIGVMEPLLTTDTAVSDGSLRGVTYAYTLSPAPTLQTLFWAAAQDAADELKAPPGNVLPFEIVITTAENLDDYSRLPSDSTGPNPVLYKATQAQLNSIVGGVNFFNLKPMVATHLRRTILIDQNYTSKWWSNSYCIVGTDTLVIRGCIFDCTWNGVGSTTTLPPMSTHFPNANSVQLETTILGIRKVGDV